MEEVRSLKVSDGKRDRKIALYKGDLAAIPAKDRVDLLVLSAFPNDYTPTPTSVIGALALAGVRIAELATRKTVDLRSTSGFWLSEDLADTYPELHARRIAVFESSRLGAPPKVIGNLFRGLFPFLDDEHDSSVAVPLLAAGDQGWPRSVMLQSLLAAAVRWMERGLPIAELKIVVRPDTPVGDLAAEFDRARTSASEASRANLLPSAADFDVFLSFSRRDAAAATTVKQGLSMAMPGVAVFDYRIAIDPGMSYQSEIDRAIESCQKVVAILSPPYFASSECQEELNIARLRNKRAGGGVLVPMYWRTISPALPMWLQALNYLNCREEDHDALRLSAKGLRIPQPPGDGTLTSR